jgi:AcrR family transcriptional regulator
MTELNESEREELWRDIHPESRRRILEAAVECFASRGYNATTTREIAARAGMSPAAVYMYFHSKHSLLYEINLAGHLAVLRAVEHALAGVEDPKERLWLFMRTHVSWHATNRTVARSCQYELRAIMPEQFEEIRHLRYRIEMALRNELRLGLETGDFVIPDLATTSLALLSLGIDVARWYVGHVQTPDELGTLYADLALRIVGANPK